MLQEMGTQQTSVLRSLAGRMAGSVMGWANSPCGHALPTPLYLSSTMPSARESKAIRVTLGLSRGLASVVSRLNPRNLCTAASPLPILRARFCSAAIPAVHLRPFPILKG